MFAQYITAFNFFPVVTIQLFIKYKVNCIGKKKNLSFSSGFSYRRYPISTMQTMEYSEEN